MVVNPYRANSPDGARCAMFDVFNKYYQLALIDPYNSFRNAMLEAHQVYRDMDCDPAFDLIVYDTFADHFLGCWPTTP